MVIAMGGADRVVTLGHHDHIVVLDRHGFIKRTIIGVNTLKGKSLGRVEAMIVGFFQAGLSRHVVGIVPVGRIVRPVAAQYHYFNVQQVVLLEVAINGQSCTLEPGDEIFIPKNGRHDVINRSDGVTRWLYGYGND